MIRPNPVVFLAVILGILLVLGLPPLVLQGLPMAKQEGDLVHLADITLRMAAGARAHVDFMTPIGGWAFAPFAFFAGRGIGLGHSVLLGQLAVALALAPAVWWVGIGRLPRGLAGLLALTVLGLTLALVPGGTDAKLTLSMHYNRWAWAIAFVMTVVAVLPPVHPKNAAVDGLILALGATALLMIKLTYLVAFLPGLVVALLLNRQYRALLAALVFGVAAAAGLSLVLGVDYWLAYIDDLRLVAGSATRARPGAPLTVMLTGPAFIGATLTGLAAIVVARRSRPALGAALLFMLPGWIYVAYQNADNDPLWLLLLGIVFLACRTGVDARGGGRELGAVALAALVLIAPQGFNLLTSPLRALGTPLADYVPIITGNPASADFLTYELRARRVDVTRPLASAEAMAGGGPGLFGRAAPLAFAGADLPDCRADVGMTAIFGAIAGDLAALPELQTARVYVADAVEPLWLFGVGQPVPGAAPWYYDGAPGLGAATHLLVPLCPFQSAARASVLAAVAARGITTDLMRETDFYRLYSLR